MRLCRTFLSLAIHSGLSKVTTHIHKYMTAGRRLKNPNSETLSSKGEWIEELGSALVVFCKGRTKNLFFPFYFCFWFKYKANNWEVRGKRKTGKLENKGVLTTNMLHFAQSKLQIITLFWTLLDSLSCFFRKQNNYHSVIKLII